MTEYSDRSRWWFFAVAVLIALAAGFFAYNLGVSHGAAVAVAQARPPAGGAPYPYPYPYGWHPHWGFGFGPFFFILLLFLLFRGWCWGWGGPWGRRWYYEDRRRVKEGASADNPGRG